MYITERDLMNIANKYDIFNIVTDKPDPSVMAGIKANWDRIAKPLDSLGDFETLVCRIGAIQGIEYPDIVKRAAVILEPRVIKSATVSTVSPSICHEVMGPDAMIFVLCPRCSYLPAENPGMGSYFSMTL